MSNGEAAIDGFALAILTHQCPGRNQGKVVGEIKVFGEVGELPSFAMIVAHVG